MRQQIPTQTKNKWISLLSLSLSLSLHLTNWILHCRATVALAAAPSLSISFFCRLTTRPPLAVGTQTRGTLLILLYLPSHCSLSLLQPPQKVKKKRRRRRRRETERGPLLPLPLPHPSSPPPPLKPPPTAARPPLFPLHLHLHTGDSGGRRRRHGCRHRRSCRCLGCRSCRCGAFVVVEGPEGEDGALRAPAQPHLPCAVVGVGWRYVRGMDGWMEKGSRISPVRWWRWGGGV